MALKCWCLDFQPQDHSFLLQSQVFANISEALSGMEEVEGEKQPAKQMVRYLTEGEREREIRCTIYR